MLNKMIKVKINDVKTLLINKLLSRGLSKEHAEIIAEDYLRGELQGKYTHGLLAFPSLFEILPLKQESPVIDKKTPSALLIDAKSNLGGVVTRKYLDHGIEMAKNNGISMILIRNMISWLRPGSIAQDIAEKDMVGFVVNSGGNPMIAPPGGYEPRVGTNPIGIGIPSEQHNILVDMATSKRAWGEVRNAALNNVDLPSETYLNDKGEFTVNPHEAVSVIPFGDYKGFVLALFIEILTGSLVNMPMNQQKSEKKGYLKLLRGAVIVIINPTFSTTLDTFRKMNNKLSEEIRTTKQRRGYSKVSVPGDKAFELENKHRKNKCIDITETLWKKLNEL
ncbi:Ldh family oxidoreductase [Candidatus Woesearchaeota archaeon]|nr:Ldh family oxidoreductase [Candidatus Woesearchaeota archaeon]